MNRTVSRALGCALMMSLATTLLTTSTTTASSATSAGPGHARPEVGSCHALTLAQAMRLSAPSRSVDCERRHTSRTLVVQRHRGGWEPEQVGPSLFAPCARTMLRVLGGSDRVRVMSAYDTFWFAPTKQERARGARWKRCELALLGGRTLRALPEKPALGSLPLPDRVARCLTGPDRRLIVTVCARSHTYRATGAFRVPGKKYPGERRLARLAERQCPERVTSERWRYQTWADASWWRVGYRSVVCYSRTTD